MHTPRNIQSPYTATDFWNKWKSVNPRMALFIKIVPVAGLSTIGFTSNSRDMTLPGHAGVTFKSAIGITPSVVEHKLNEANNLELTGIYRDDIFKREDVLSGRWNFATVEVFSACWETPDLGEFLHFKGNIGEFKDYERYFTAEGRGYIARLSNDAGPVTTRNCRVKTFKDSQCGFTGTTVTINGTTYDLTYTGASPDLVTNSRNKLTIPDSFWTDQSKPVPPLDFFNNGTITCTSGLNAGITREILKSSSPTAQTRVILMRGFPYRIDVDDVFTLSAGCNRTLDNCKLYNNVINFRGEPFVPGIEVMNRIPASQ